MICHRNTFPNLSSCATCSITVDFPDPGAPVISNGRRNRSAALTTSTNPSGGSKASPADARGNVRHGGGAGSRTSGPCRPSPW
ncbi:hypothetical protein GCM10009839_62590 [Catenulispora yoronensis]|uniref:Uncharacterized protein n=1 Tax=Catenulispora yoronensis TaxID=450799 RepID=A0ABN2V1L4_9ACTN